MEGAHHPYMQLEEGGGGGELNCEGRGSRGLVEGILKAPRAAALRPNVTEHNYDGRVNTSSERKPEYREKTHYFWQIVD